MVYRALHSYRQRVRVVTLFPNILLTDFAKVFERKVHKPNLESTSKYGFSPRFGGKKWRCSEHAHASYPGLFFRPPGLSPIWGGKRVQGLDYALCGPLHLNARIFILHLYPRLS